MTGRTLFVALVAVPLALAGCSTVGGDPAANLDPAKVASSVGITSQQAQEGIGCMLIEAQRKLEISHYEEVVRYIPSADEYMAVAKDACVFKGSVSTPGELNAALSDLGLSPEQSAKLMAEVTDYLSKAGDPSVVKLFSGAMR